MKQADLDRAVAHATGETVATIKRLGFLLADPVNDLDPDLDVGFDDGGPQVIDWDALEAARYDGSSRRPHDEPAAA